jgi:hypothetical protein
VATGCSGVSPASPPQPAKVVGLVPGTQHLGQAIERWWWKKGSDIKEEGGARFGSVPKEVTGNTTCVGARGGVVDLVMAKPSTLMNTSERAGSAKGSCSGGTKWCAVRVNPNCPVARPLLYPIATAGFSRLHGPLAGLLQWRLA